MSPDPVKAAGCRVCEYGVLLQLVVRATLTTIRLGANYDANDAGNHAGNNGRRLGSSGFIPDNIWVQVFFLRPNVGVLLPNLTDITWTAWNKSSVTHLHLTTKEDCTLDAISGLLKSLGKRSNTLQRLLLENSSLLDVQKIGAIVGPFLQTQGQLRELTVERFSITKEMARAMCELSLLEEILTWEGGGFPAQERGMQWEPTDLACSSLKSLHINTLPHLYGRHFRSHVFSRLSELGIEMPVASNEELLPFLKEMAHSCPTLTGLNLNLFTSPGTVTQPISFDSLSPLLKCPGISSFRVGHNKPIRVDSHDVAAMSSSWAGLTVLSLCMDPTEAPLDTTIGISLSITPLRSGLYSGTRPRNINRGAVAVCPTMSGPKCSSSALASARLSLISQQHIGV
ncbi:hypothetical protein FRB93_009308 [Tulasnella sp. JGI-2019a]|nr:hypothetical protein FRB93_009308 [Tulasnella sp. JGI-2019a]